MLYAGFRHPPTRKEQVGIHPAALVFTITFAVLTAGAVLFELATHAPGHSVFPPAAWEAAPPYWVD